MDWVFSPYLILWVLPRTLLWGFLPTSETVPASHNLSQQVSSGLQATLHSTLLRNLLVSVPEINKSKSGDHNNFSVGEETYTFTKLLHGGMGV